MTDPLTRLRALGVALEKTDEYEGSVFLWRNHVPCTPKAKSDAVIDELATGWADALERATRADSELARVTSVLNRSLEFLAPDSVLAKLRLAQAQLAAVTKERDEALQQLEKEKWMLERLSDQHWPYNEDGNEARRVAHLMRLSDEYDREATDESQ